MAKGCRRHPAVLEASQLPLRFWSIWQLAMLSLPDALSDAIVTPSTLSWQVTLPPVVSCALIE